MLYLFDELLMMSISLLMCSIVLHCSSIVLHSSIHKGLQVLQASIVVFLLMIPDSYDSILWSPPPPHPLMCRVNTSPRRT